MRELIAQVDELASVVMSADPEDLPGLAEAHSRLEKLAACIEEMGEAAESIATVRDNANTARRLLEKLILNEVEDAAASFGSIIREIGQLQEMLEQASSGKPLTAPESNRTNVSSDSPALQTAPHASQPARIFNADDLPLLQEFIGESTGHIESAEADLLKLEEEPDDAEAISSIFRAFHTIKGVAGFLNLEAIQKLAHAAENLLDRARQGQLRLTGQASDLVMQSIDQMKSLVGQLDQSIRSGAPYAAEDVAPLCARLDAFVRTGQVVATQTRPCLSAQSPTTGSDAVGAVAETGAQAKRADAASADSSIKVSTERLDSLINMVGELVIAQSMVGQDVSHIARDNPRLARNVTHLGKITRELQDLSMSLRMVPLTGVFRKMARVVRDVARKAGKQVEFVQTGSDTELDRNVVEQIADPLVHMVRNSVDHGIETPEQRQAAGKPRAGRIELKAYHQAGNINIEVIDDGKGINKRRVLDKAIAAGLVAPQDQLSDNDIFKLLFHPGLSTAEQVTDISGRGVGMDVVKRNIDALRGRIDIASTEGKGSVFTIRLPLTLAVIDGLIVKVGSQKYILPITSIEQSLRPKADQISTVQGRGEVCMVRGALLPVIRLHERFGLTPASTDPTAALFVIVQDNDRRVCLLVDELLGQEQVVIKSLGEGLEKLKGISGGAVLGDGNVSLILDVPGLVELAEQ